MNTAQRRKFVLCLLQAEYIQQIKNRSGWPIPDNDIALIEALFIQIPVTADGSLKAVFTWRGEKLAEIYHKGHCTIIVGFYPQKNKGELR